MHPLDTEANRTETAALDQDRRTRLQVEGRDHAIFNFAIDSKLRGCDVARVKPKTLRRMAKLWTA